MVRRRSSARKKRAVRPAYVSSVGGPPARRSGGWVALILGALVLVNLYVFVWDTKTQKIDGQFQSLFFFRSPIRCLEMNSQFHRVVVARQT